MEQFVLDTSIFTNPDIYGQFGQDTESALQTFLDIAHASDAEFYMPRSVYNELDTMKDLDKIAPDFESVVRIRSPRRFNIQIPANIVYELIDEVRKRIDRGLRIAEEHTKLGYAGSTEKDVGAVISRLRERYRETLRQGIIDSREDMDVLLLAYELDGVIVAADEGLRTWADKIGVKILMPKHMRTILEKSVKQ
ncbi:MAG: RNA ligase partner protein [Gammaproteobacteria bacterium]|jgi:RNA ligase partner protein|nr:RNA ligase partner protein [Gammaproteobacteria bacterium]